MEKNSSSNDEQSLRESFLKKSHRNPNESSFTNQDIKKIIYRSQNDMNNLIVELKEEILKCLDGYSRDEDEKYSIDKEKNIFHSRIFSITLDKSTKKSPNKKEISKQNSGFFESINIERITSCIIRCSIMQERSSEKNIKILTKFFKENECEISNIEELSKDNVYECVRLINLYSDFQELYSQESLKSLDCSLNNQIFLKMIPRHEFQIKIDLKKNPNNELKANLINHFNRRIIKDGKEINKFSQDITDIIDQSFQKYLEKNKLTFDFNPGSTLENSQINEVSSRENAENLSK
jgi:hypothetical protein